MTNPTQSQETRCEHSCRPTARDGSALPSPIIPCAISVLVLIITLSGVSSKQPVRLQSSITLHPNGHIGFMASSSSSFSSSTASSSSSSSSSLAAG